MEMDRRTEEEIMEDKALLKILVDMLAYYKHQSKVLVWVVVIVLLMHLATVVGFLYYESHMTTTTTTTTTTEQNVDGDDGSIVNGDQYNDTSQNRSTQ